MFQSIKSIVFVTMLIGKQKIKYVTVKIWIWPVYDRYLTVIWPLWPLFDRVWWIYITLCINQQNKSCLRRYWLGKRKIIYVIVKIWIWPLYDRYIIVMIVIWPLWPLFDRCDEYNIILCINQQNKSCLRRYWLGKRKIICDR